MEQNNLNNSRLIDNDTQFAIICKNAEQGDAEAQYKMGKYYEDRKKAMLVRIVNQAEKYYRLNKSNDDSKLIYKKAVTLEAQFLACGEFGYGSYDITELENHICNKLVELEHYFLIEYHTKHL